MFFKRNSKIVFFITIFLVLCSAESKDRTAEMGFKIIVNKRNSDTTLSLQQVSRIFLKKEKRWSSGEIITPVDQQIQSSVRMVFSEKILLRSILAVKNYWQQMIFSGRNLPPIELSSDQEVVEYVSNNKTAIGYVSIETDTQKVKLINLE